ncbi:MAG: protein-L-isoaspartate(D-aspartate) O-methyltransferase [Spirochaetales bacterium]|nr:protein-L-isoaspartate(D-aspartate) O-methyltransferase [Spirochaetales bacterium]
MKAVPENSYSEKMVKMQIIARGVTDPFVIQAMKTVPRHFFVEHVEISQAYGDFPLPIGYGQTISQPYMVALMTELLNLKKSDCVLEVGTGSGYQTSVLANIVSMVYTVERIAPLTQKARRIHCDMGITNIEYKTGDGSVGWAEKAPFNKIIVTAAAPNIIEDLKWQLADRGILVIPVGDYRSYQKLMVVIRRGAFFDVSENIGCRFVPLIGHKGFWVKPNDY